MYKSARRAGLRQGHDRADAVGRSFRAAREKRISRLSFIALALALAIALALALSLGTAGAQTADDATPPVASVPGAAELLGVPDEAIGVRLQEIFANIDGLTGVTVSVDAGVVSLAGTVRDPDARKKAITLARAIGGVVEVEDGMEIDHNVARRLEPVWERVSEAGLRLAGSAPLLGVAAVILVLAWALGRLIVRGKWLRRVAPNAFVAELLLQTVRVAVFLAGLLLALDILGLTAFLGSIVGALGLVGLAIGFAVRDTVENFIASVMLSLRQPFAPNDLVAIEGHEGRIARLTSRATILMDTNGNHVRIPNATVYKSTIVNYTRNPNRRFLFEAGIDPLADAAAAQGIAEAALKRIPQVLEQPEAVCVVRDLGDSNVVLAVSGWIDQRQSDFQRTRSAAILAVVQAFERSGIGLPEPAFNVRMQSVPDEAETSRPAPRSPSFAPETLDLEPDRSLEEQIRTHDQGPDLLDSDAPQE